MRCFYVRRFIVVPMLCPVSCNVTNLRLVNEYLDYEELMDDLYGSYDVLESSN